MRLPGWMCCVLPLLWACSNSDQATTLALTSVSPATKSMGECIDVKVGLTGVAPLTLDYGTSSAEAVTVKQVSIGPQRFEASSLQWASDGFHLPLSADLPEGKQDVRALLSNGQELVLPGGFEVTPPLQIDGFAMGYVVDHAPGESFPISIWAQGPDAARFQGKVYLSADRAVLQPAESAPFQNGELTQFVTLSAPPETFAIIHVVDCQGRRTESNEFVLDYP